MDRRSIVLSLLAETSLAAKRRTVAHDRRWQRVFPGFRPDRLRDSDFENKAALIGQQVELILALADACIAQFGHTLAAAVGDATTRREITAKAPKLSPIISELDTARLRTLPVRTPGDRSLHAIAGADAEPRVPPPVLQPATDAQRAAHDEPDEDISLPPATPEMLVWTPPDDDVNGLQEIITLFERSLHAFIQWRLEQLHGDAWLRKGCGPWRRTWREKAPGEATPATLLGFAELGDLKDILISSDNWPTFKPYFATKDFVRLRFDQIIKLRHPSMHPGQRTLHAVQHAGSIQCMLDIVEQYSPDIASWLNDLYDAAIMAPTTTRLFDRVLTNLTSIPPDPDLIGRDSQISALADFWQDRYQRTQSIIGAGGVGKTALLSQFLHNTLDSWLPLDERPVPEVVIYLTARTHETTDSHRVPSEQQFGTLRALCESTLAVLGQATSADMPINALRRSVYDHAATVPILFALDNLETLEQTESEALNAFLAALPAPSKAILTTRDGRHLGETLKLEGLPTEQALQLLERKLDEFGVALPDDSDPSDLKRLVQETSGVPIYVLHCANLLASGESASSAVDRIRGRGMLKLMEFSFESSFRSLSDTHLAVLYYLSVSRSPRTRKDMLFLVADEEELDDALLRLRQLSFVTIAGHESGRQRFKVATLQIRDYSKKRAQDRLESTQLTNIAKRADVPFEVMSSRPVSEAVETVIQQARTQARYGDQETAMRLLLTAKSEFNNDPRILAELGYRHFRMHERTEARKYLVSAVSSEFESSEAYANLALVELYDRNFDEARTRAEAALNIAPDNKLAKQVLGEALVEKAKRDRLVLDRAQWEKLLREARFQLEGSKYGRSERGSSWSHNERADRFLSEIAQLLTA